MLLLCAGEPWCKGSRRDQPRHGEADAADIRRRPAADLHADATRFLSTFPRLRNLQAVAAMTRLIRRRFVRVALYGCCRLGTVHTAAVTAKKAGINKSVSQSVDQNSLKYRK